MALRTPLSVTPHLYMGDSTGRPLDKGVVYFGEQDKDPEFYPINLFSDDALTKPLMQPVHTKGGYLYDKGDMVEPHAKELIYSVKVLDSYGRKVFYKGAMMRNSWNDDVIEQINAALVSTAEEAAQIATDVAKEIADKAVASIGFVTIDSFELGATLTQRNQVLRHAVDGRLYRWAGKLPKVVPTNSTPTSSGGMGDNAWLEVSDITLRQELSNPDKGAVMIGRGVVAVDSIADLLALPEGQRKKGLRYLVKGYHAGSDVGGGEFYWDSSRTSENDGGCLLGGFIRVNTSGIVSLHEYGVIEGEDITLKIQAAVDIAAIKRIRRVEIPKGEYWVNVARSRVANNSRLSYGVLLKDNIDIISSATLKAIPNNVSGGSVFMFDSCKNSSITGGYYVGEKYDHKYGSSNHEWGHGIMVRGNCEYIKLDGLHIRDFMGDGICIKSNLDLKLINNIEVLNCHIFECRRHELTITSGNRIRIIGNTFSKLNPVKDGIANATYGGLNVDVEPWFEPSTQTSEEYVSDIIFENNKFECATNACLRISTNKVPTKQISILNNSFSGTELCTLTSAEDVIISGNTCTHNLLGRTNEGEAWGIRFTGVTNGSILNNYVKNSSRPIMVTPGTYGVKNENITITGNTVELLEDKQYFGGISTSPDSNNVLINHNIVHKVGADSSIDNSSSLLSAMGKGVIVANNLLSSNGSMRGMRLSGEANVSNNIISNVKTPFIRVYGATLQGNISNNLFLGDISYTGTSVVNLQEVGSSITFSGNVFDFKNNYSILRAVSFSSSTGYSKVNFLCNDFSRVNTAKSDYSGADARWFGNILSNGTVDGIPTSTAGSTPTSTVGGTPTS